MADQPIKRVATVLLPVADQDRSLAFFRDLDAAMAGPSPRGVGETHWTPSISSFAT